MQYIIWVILVVAIIILFVVALKRNKSSHVIIEIETARFDPIGKILRIVERPGSLEYAGEIKNDLGYACIKSRDPAEGLIIYYVLEKVADHDGEELGEFWMEVAEFYFLREDLDLRIRFRLRGDRVVRWRINGIEQSNLGRERNQEKAEEVRKIFYHLRAYVPEQYRSYFEAQN